MEGFPLINQLNNHRLDLHKIVHPDRDNETGVESHNPNHPKQDSAFGERAAAWMQHKAVSIISFPANCVGVGLGVTGMFASVCTIGALKVAIFAVSLGNVELDIPTGFLFCLGATLHSAFHLIRNTGEISYDAVHLTAKVFETAYNGARYVARALDVEEAALRILQGLRNFLDRTIGQIGRQLSYGFSESIKDEDIVTEIPLISGLNKATADASCFKENLTIGHVILSIADVPSCAAAGIVAGAVACLSLPLFAVKVCVVALINRPIHVPTGAAYSTSIVALSVFNILRDTIGCVADGAIIIYKVADALQITTAVATLGLLILYIPAAILR